MTAVSVVQSYAGMVIFDKMAKDTPGMENATLQLGLAMVTALAFAGLKHSFPITVANSEWIPILVLGLLNTGIGCYLYFSSIPDLPVQTVAINGYLEPLSALVFSALILGERILPLQILGAVLIIGGALFAELYKKGSTRLLFNSDK